MSMDRRRTPGYLSLRDAMDRLVAGSVLMPEYMQGGVEGWPPTNLRVTDEDVVVSMAIPGANPDDLNLSVTGDTVTISGEVTRVDGGTASQGGPESRHGQTYLEEIWHGKFQRSFTLPIQVDANKASASYEHGILTLTLPKSEATKPRKIQVRAQQTIQGGTQGSQSQGTQGNVERENIPVQSGGSS